MYKFFEEDISRSHSTDALPTLENVSVSRRDLMNGALSASALILAVQVFPAKAREALKSYPTGGDGMPNKTVSDPRIFIAIDAEGNVTIASHRAEMGTGITTSLPMVVADEMCADWARVRIMPTHADEPRYGNQDTDGSRSMRHFIQPMRQCGAAMRQMLETAAAQKWRVDVTRCQAKNHTVVLFSPDLKKETGKTLGFGELAVAAMAHEVPSRDKLLFKSPDKFSYMGKGKIKCADHQAITTGKAIYGADVRLTGMKFAVMVRPPVLGARLKKYDAKEALKIPGVEGVYEIEGVYDIPRKFGILGGIAVVGNTTYAAIKGREALTVEWNDGPNAGYNTEDYIKEMQKTASQPGLVLRNQGDPEAAFANGDQIFSADYIGQHIAQAPMEPLVAVARIKDGKAEVWAPAQSPWGARNDVAAALKMPIEEVILHSTLLGGAFGRKSKSDFVVEAAVLSKKLSGAPVLMQWTREDDIKHGFYHAVSVERVEMAIDKKGKVSGWRHRTVAPSIVSTFKEDNGYQFPIEYDMGFVSMPYDIPNVRCENGKAMAHTRIGWFRSVLNIPRVFATQSATCEVAYKLGKDPKDFLLEIIGPDRKLDPKALGFPKDYLHYGDPYEEFPIDTARLKNVIRVASQKAGWGKKLPPRHGLGIAAHCGWQSYVATVVQAKLDADGTIRVPEVHTAIDCGFAVNPERVRSQMEGAAVMGMTLALNSQITFKNGAVEQSNFTDYPVARMSNYPKKVNVYIIDGPQGSHPSGVGEPGLPPFAPALANAIFAITKKRVRSLPMGEKIT
ncbi:MAG: molybdopterin cofactor-binding domain-containing protein [Hyphomicrobium sp.]